MIWNQQSECMPIEERQKLQLERLQKTVKRIYENVPLYKAKFDAAGIKPGDVRSLDDLRHLPFTTKEDLRDSYPFGMFAVPLEEVVRVHSSSGTTGKPKVVGYTRNDIKTWGELVARVLGCSGVTRKDVMQVSYGYGLFTGGLGLHYGGETMGCTVIPISGGNTRRQIMIMKDFGATVLACTPSYALYMAETMREAGIDPSELKLRCGIHGAEPWTDGMRKELEKKLGYKAYDVYGLSEIMGPGVSNECEYQNGLHVFDDHFIPEIVDPVTGESLPDGTSGELVFTSLTKEAFPILRYRTRDISSITHEPCACGRTHARMTRISGRCDDMLIIRGVNVFPSQIESVLLEMEGIEPHYMLVVNRVGPLDELEVWVEISEKYFSDEIRKLEALGKRIQSEIASTLNISCKVKLVEPKTIERSEGKATRVIDNRPKN